jgi:hypothetical protein
MFCATVLIMGGTEGVGSRFNVLCYRTRFRRYRGRQVLFAYFALRDSFSAIPRASGPVFMFCALGLVFEDTEGVGSSFHVLRSRTRFRLHYGRWLRFSCFARPNSIWAVPTVSGPVFMFAFPGTFSAVRRNSGLVFMFCAPGLIFGGSEGIRSLFPFLRARIRFRRYRRRRDPF